MKKLKKNLLLNWKEYGNLALVADFIEKASKSVIFRQVNSIFCINSLLIYYCCTKINNILKKPANNEPKCGSDFFMRIGSQFVDSVDGTGRIRGQSLFKIGCEYAMCGHVERGETDIPALVQECETNGITPIVFFANSLCCEKMDLSASPSLTMNLPLDSILVYEPKYAIGSGVVADMCDIQEFVDVAREMHPGRAVLYGGSVDESNAEEISRITDGLCVGRASRDFARAEKIAAAMVQGFERDGKIQ